MAKTHCLQFVFLWGRKRVKVQRFQNYDLWRASGLLSKKRNKAKRKMWYIKEKNKEHTSAIEYNLYFGPLSLRISVYILRRWLLSHQRGKLSRKGRNVTKVTSGAALLKGALSVLVRLSGWSCRLTFLKMWSKADSCFNEPWNRKLLRGFKLRGAPDRLNRVLFPPVSTFWEPCYVVLQAKSNAKNTTTAISRSCRGRVTSQQPSPFTSPTEPGH